jgi:hypothetical protein
MQISELPNGSIENARFTGDGKRAIMVSRILKKLNTMVEEHNAENSFFKLQFNLGHVLTIMGILAVIVPMWINVIGDDAQARMSLVETHAILEEMKTHISAIDKEVTMAVIDDDRLMRVQADVKEIQARVQAIQDKLR